MTSKLKMPRCEVPGCKASVKTADTFVKIDGKWFCRAHLPEDHPMLRPATVISGPLGGGMTDATLKLPGEAKPEAVEERKPDAVAERVPNALDERIDDDIPGFDDRDPELMR